jgi:hypothetical protein
MVFPSDMITRRTSCIHFVNHLLMHRVGQWLYSEHYGEGSVWQDRNEFLFTKYYATHLVNIISWHTTICYDDDDRHDDNMIRTQAENSKHNDVRNVMVGTAHSKQRQAIMICII